MECDKRTYESSKDAADDLIGLRQRSRRHKFSMYKCPLCGKYHITTITKKTLRPDKMSKYPIEIPTRPQPKQKNKGKRK